jgi:DDE superfamily endonuclease
MDNGKTLGFRGDDNVKYADVVSAGVGMTMVVRLTGGPHATICPPFMIFQNDNCSYPIRGVPDDVPGVSYRTAKKGFMTREVWLQWLQERRAQATIRSQRRVVFVDNVSSHDLESEGVKNQLSRLNASFRFLVANATDKIQPCDSYVISKIKDSWMAHWESYKLDAIKKGMWQDVSGAIKNPGKRFFLKLAATAVQEVNSCRDSQGLTYARKAMIRCGLSLDVTGQWHIEQLNPDLQNIIKNHRNHFDGEPVPEM